MNTQIDFMKLLETTLNAKMVPNYESNLNKNMSSLQEEDIGLLFTHQKLFIQETHINITEIIESREESGESLSSNNTNTINTNTNNTNTNNINTTNNNKSYCIDLDNVLAWTGITHKSRAKHLLEKHFIINQDYIIIPGKSVTEGNVKKPRGGHNKEIILLTMKTFQLLSLRADTIKSNQLFEYYLSLEQVILKTIKDETYELTSKKTQEGDFLHTVDEIVPLLCSNKRSIVNHLMKNYKEKIHYTYGYNGEYLLSEYTFCMIKMSFPLRNNYLLNVTSKTIV